ncbi:MAG: DUF302 domain-containing protein [Bacteroidales bacterium]|nr:DUF302 domain-containing protein [Bacteroidales bacterium]
MSGLLIEKASPYSLEKTAELIVAESERQNWKVPAVHDLQQTLAKSGKVVMPVKVIELCKPELAGKILELNHERSISVFMPCRISVYEKEDGITYLSVMNAEAMAGFLPESVAGIMVEAATGSLSIIDAALGS